MLAPLLANAEAYRTFTDKKGRKMEARVVRVEGEKVFIERKDGLTTSIPVNLLPESDQQYVQTQKQSRISSDRIDFRFKTNVSDKSKWAFDGGLEERNWKEGREIVITNEANDQYDDLRIESILFKFED